MLAYLLTYLVACLAALPSYLPTYQSTSWLLQFHFSSQLIYVHTSRANILLLLLLLFSIRIFAMNSQSSVISCCWLLLLYILNKYAGCHFRLYDSPSYNVIVSRVSYIRIVYNFHFTDCNFRKLYRSFIHNWRTLHCNALYALKPHSHCMTNANEREMGGKKVMQSLSKNKNWIWMRNVKQTN